MRRVFFSFHFQKDAWRTSQVRNIRHIDGSKQASDNDWETIKRGGDTAIKRWIGSQLDGRTCTVVLIGSNTANRDWINYEISESWKRKMGVFGIYIHNLKHSDLTQSPKGKNPFDYLTFGTGGPKLSTVIKTYDAPYTDSKKVYEYIALGLSDWIEESIRIRNAR